MHTRFDTEARVAVTQAVDIARELGHREVGPDHLLLGLLANPRGTAYAALRDHGVHLDTARELVAEGHNEPESTYEDREPAASAYDDDREALRAIGIDLDSVREAVRTNLGQDLAEGWGDRPERGGRRGDRRRGRRRGRHHGHHHDHDHDEHDHAEHEHDEHEHDEHEHEHDEHERGRGRRGPRSRRPDGPRFSRELRGLLRDVHRTVRHEQLEAGDGGDRRDVRRVPGLTGARLLVALTRCEDAATRAVLATADSIDGLRAQAESAAHPAGA